MRRSVWKDEAELVSATVDWLQAEGWETYCEVAPWGSGAPRADVVATRGALTAVVECKLSLGFPVLEQCRGWVGKAHLVWAASPLPYAGRGSLKIQVAEWLGVGVVHPVHPVDRPSDEMLRRYQCRVGWAGPDVQITVAPRFFRRVDDAKIRNCLVEAQKSTSPGAGHGFVTPFTQTCQRLYDAVRNTTGGRLAVKDAIARVKHHYSSSACARSSLITHTERGIVDGLRVVREGRRVFFEVKTGEVATP